jgi:hypothetical protein
MTDELLQQIRREAWAAAARDYRTRPLDPATRDRLAVLLRRGQTKAAA